jgi:hypothetical protein
VQNVFGCSGNCDVSVEEQFRLPAFLQLLKATVENSGHMRVSSPRRKDIGREISASSLSEEMSIPRMEEL